MSDSAVVPVERLDFSLVPRPWRYADENRSAIDAHFAVRQRARPEMWNGRVLIAHEHRIENGVCSGAYLETDYASFVAWRDWGRPAADVTDSFSAAVLRAADGAFLLGVMSAHTANAGLVYFPCGTPDPRDVVDGRVDLERSASRELAEETGLEFAALRAEPGWFVVTTGPLILHAKLLSASEPADALRRRILDHLATQPRPELTDIRIVRSPSDFDPRMPPFVVQFLRYMWR